jgi:2-polyprenyl-3-methyl-5-hydroxy-6-metoxy-1,4-benzoquinol methylase
LYNTLIMEKIGFNNQEQHPREEQPPKALDEQDNPLTEQAILVSPEHDSGRPKPPEPSEPTDTPIQIKAAKLIHQITPLYAPGESAGSLQKEVERESSWTGLFNRLKRRILGGGDKQETVMTYTENKVTNYPDILPYEYGMAGDYYWHWPLELLEDHLTSGNPVIVEFGCGPGTFAAALKAKHHNIEYYGADFYDPVLQRAAKLLPDGTFHHVDLNNDRALQEYLNELPDEINGFILLDVLEHIKDPARQTVILNTLFSRLKPGGFLFVGMPETPDWGDNPIRILTKLIFDIVDKDPSHHNKPTTRRFTSLIAKPGFEMTKSSYYFPMPRPFGGFMNASFWGFNRLVLAQKPQSN